MSACAEPAMIRSLILFGLVLGAFSQPPLRAVAPIRVLIVDGYSNHDWKLTTALIRGILEPTGLFTVDVSTAPPTQEAPGWETWRPKFADYEVVIQTCNDIRRGPSWPRVVQEDLEKFVARGGGLYVWHAGNNAFPDWPAYNAMIGLGWRKQDFGGAVAVKDDGTLVFIPAGEGRDTGHGARVDTVVRRRGDHPIHAGLPRAWKTPDLEVYHHARGPAQNLDVLSYGFDPVTQMNWPLEWTVAFGQGRVYTSTLGHVWAGDVQPERMRCAGLQTVVVRALQWLARREPTFPVPQDFPTAEKVSVRAAIPPPASGFWPPRGIAIVPRLPPTRTPSFREQDLAGYVMVYFKDETHSAYLAISRDGYTFTDVNGGEPVFDGARLAEQQGVRDPHLTRGPDGAFYLAMTDLHIYGQRAGFRATRWQRPEEQYGWGNNRALVLMKSWDLIHWTHSDFRVDLAFPELGDIDCAWAPETTYDPIAGQMMVYFTIRYGNKHANIYWAYADPDFTKLVTVPQKIPGIGGIDGDLTYVDGKWHLYYVGNAQIRHAVSDQITSGYEVEARRIDPESKATEAPNVFRRLGTDTYVLMYDVYGARPNNMGFSETKDFAAYQDLGHFNEGVMRGSNFERPKHGAVTYLTRDELRAIAAHWQMPMDLE